MIEPCSSPPSSTAVPGTVNLIASAEAAGQMVDSGSDVPVPSLVDSNEPSPVTHSLSSLQKDLREAREEVSKLREANDKLKEQLLQATRRENILILRLASKDKAFMELKDNADRVKKNGAAGAGSVGSSLATETMLQKALVDPAVNLVFERMRKEVEDARSKVTEMQSELSAWKFTPDSTTGKRLMAKCRLLYQENEELGKMISSGKVAKLEGELALQKNFAEEIRKSQSEIDDFLIELDEDFEGMQTTIIGLQTQLKEVKDQLLSFQTNMFKQNGNGSTDAPAADSPENHPHGETGVSAVVVAESSVVPDDAPVAATDSVPVEESVDTSPPDEQSNGVKRVVNEDSTLDSHVSKRTKSEVDADDDSDAVISCSMDSSSFVDSSEATPAAVP